MPDRPRPDRLVPRHLARPEAAARPGAGARRPAAPQSVSADREPLRLRNPGPPVRGAGPHLRPLRGALSGWRRARATAAAAGPGGRAGEVEELGLLAVPAGLSARRSAGHAPGTVGSGLPLARQALRLLGHRG